MGNKKRFLRHWILFAARFQHSAAVCRLSELWDRWQNYKRYNASQILESKVQILKKPTHRHYFINENDYHSRMKYQEP